MKAVKYAWESFMLHHVFWTSKQFGCMMSNNVQFCLQIYVTCRSQMSFTKTWGHEGGTVEKCHLNYRKLHHFPFWHLFPWRNDLIPNHNPGKVSCSVNHVFFSLSFSMRKCWLSHVWRLHCASNARKNHMMNHPPDQVRDPGCLASTIEIAVVWGVCLSMVSSWDMLEAFGWNLGQMVQYHHGITGLLQSRMHLLFDCVLLFNFFFAFDFSPSTSLMHLYIYYNYICIPLKLTL